MIFYLYQIWETELVNERKRKVPEGSPIVDEGTTPVKNMRNINVNTSQKHLNLSQIYSKFSQPTTHSEHLRGTDLNYTVFI